MTRVIQKTLQLRGAHPHLMQLKIPLKTRLTLRLTLSLTAIQEKFARILLSVACELWLRGQIASVEDVLLQTARALTIRLAEKLAQAMSSLMRLAESMVTPETECLLYATYWFRPILSELIGSARESSEVNRSRAAEWPS